MDRDEPVGLGALGVLVQNRVEHVAVHQLGVAAVDEIDQVVRQQGDLGVVVQGDKARHMLAHAQLGAVLLFQLGAAIPDDHDKEQQQRQQDRDIAAVQELAEGGDKEDRLDRAEDEQHEHGENGLAPQLEQVHRQQQRRHQHRQRDGKTVGRFDPRAGAEVEHHKAAADPEQVVDLADIELALGVGGIADLKVRQQVEQDRLGHQRVRPGDQRLGGDDRGGRAEHDGKGAQRLRQHQEEGVEIFDGRERAVAAALQDPGALAEIVEDQAQLDEGPGEINVFLADVPHVGIQRLRARRGEEHAAEDHEAQLVRGAEEDAHGIDRVKGAQHDGQRRDVQQPRHAEETEPQQHDRPKGLADAAGAGVLDREERRDDQKRDDHDLPLARAEEAVHALDRAQTFDRRRHCHGGRQNPVGQQRRAAKHRRQDQPFAIALDQRIERKDAALTVVVRLHGDKHVFDRGQKRDRPDDERERADDKRLVHRGDAAVALEDRLHDVQRRGADVAVDDADRHEKQTEAKSFFIIHIRKSSLSESSLP